MTRKISPLLMGALAGTAVLLAACGGGGGAGIVSPQADIAAMAGVYHRDYAPGGGGGVEVTVIADDQGRFMGTSYNDLPDYFQTVEFSGTVAALSADGTWSAPGSLISSDLGRAGDSPAAMTATVTGSFTAGQSMTYSLPSPPLLVGYPPAVTMQRVTNPDGPYLVSSLAGHYRTFESVTGNGVTRSWQVADFDLGADGHLHGWLGTVDSHSCTLDGTLVFARTDVNVARSLGTMSNCDTLSGTHTFLGTIDGYNTSHPSFSLWTPKSNGQIAKIDIGTRD
jgi:hypothetical protein